MGPALYLQILPNAYDEKVCTPFCGLKVMHHVQPVMSHNTRLANPQTLVHERKGHGSLNNHTLLKTTITPIVCAKRNDQKARAQKGKWRRGNKGGMQGSRAGEEKHDSSIRPP